MKKNSIKLRFNTECTDNRLFWRVLINGKEGLAAHVSIQIPVETTTDYLSEKGIVKHHISCECESLIWENDNLIIR